MTPYLPQVTDSIYDLVGGEPRQVASTRHQTVDRVFTGMDADRCWHVM